MLGLSCDEIVQYLEDAPGFIGCFASNIIPSIRRLPCSFIVNTEKMGHPGSHWVAVHMSENHCLYFDSFGLPIMEEDIFKYIETYYTHTVFNQTCIQDWSSVACGLFCIAFIKNVFSVESFNHFINCFSTDNLIANDNIVKYYI